VLAGWDIRYQR